VTSGRHTVNLTSTSINDGGAFDVNTDTFTPPSNGLYFLHISVEIDTHVAPGTGNVSLTCNDWYAFHSNKMSTKLKRVFSQNGVRESIKHCIL
jgi:hypothetical protein